MSRPQHDPEEVVTLVAEVTAGRGAVALCPGDLAEQRRVAIAVQAAAAAAGLPVVVAAGSRAEQDQPHEVLRQLLGPTLVGLDGGPDAVPGPVRALIADPGGEPAPDPVLATGVADVVRAAGAAAGAVWVVTAADRLDRESEEVLLRLARRAGTLPLLLVLAGADPTAPALSELATLPHVRTRAAPTGPTSTHAEVDVGAPGAVERLRAAAEVAGRAALPALYLQLGLALQIRGDGEAARRAYGAGLALDPGEGTLPDQLRAGLVDLRRLDQRFRPTVQVMLDDVDDRDPTPGGRWLAAVRAVEQAAGGRADVAVALAEHALGDDLLVDLHGPGSPPVLLAVRALVLADAGGRAREVLRDLEARAVDADPAVLGWIGARALQVAAGAGDVTAVRQGTAALATLGDDLPAAVRLAALTASLRADVLELGGDVAWTRSAVLPVPAEYDGTAAGAYLALVRAWAALPAGRWDDAERLAGYARTWSTEIAGRESVATLSWRPVVAAARAGVGDRDAARELLHAELAAARAWGGPTPLSRALRQLAVVSAPDDGAELLEEAVEVADRIPLPSAEQAAVRTARARVLRLLDEPDLAAAEAAEAVARAQSLGATALASRAAEELSALDVAAVRRQGPDELTPAEERVAVLAAEGLSNRRLAATLSVSVKAVEGHLSSVYRKLQLGGRAELPGALGARTAPLLP